jgi:predicted transcriptional regulator
MQDGNSIAFVSKSLPQSEINYAQIVKETFAISFGCKHFHQYVYGRKVHV